MTQMDISNSTGLELPPSGSRCTEVLSDTLKGYSGIHGVELDTKKGRLQVMYDPRAISDEHAMRLVRQAGKLAWERVSHCAFKGDNACSDCLTEMSKELGVHYQKLAVIPIEPVTNFNNGVMSVQLNKVKSYPAEVLLVEEQYGPKEELAAVQIRMPRAKVEVAFTIITVLATLAAFLGQFFDLSPAWVISALYILAYLTGGYYGLLDGIEVLKERRLDVNFLMIMAALGAAAIGQPLEGAILLFLFSLSNTLQTYAMGRSRKAIEKLLDLRPPVATRRRGENLETVPVESLLMGDLVLVRPGERFPIDGDVVEGSSDVDQSTITGESIPVQKEPGSQVFAGTLNGSGALELRVNRHVQNTTLAKIVKMVEEAQTKKAQTQRMLDNFEQVYALLVLAGAVLLVVIPYLLLNQDFQPTFYRSMTWLVVASPCALVISTPASILAAIASGARRGVLFKGGVHLEQTAGIKVVAFDKTGTLTTGSPSLTGIRPFGGTSEDDLLRIAAAIESRSEHPLASAIVKAAQKRRLVLPPASEFQSISGQGVEACVDDRSVWIGNERLFRERRIPIPLEILSEVRKLENEGQTVMMVRSEEEWLGLLAVADTLRDDAAQIVARLKELGVERVVMLTGDNERVASNIAAKTGVDEFHAGMLPQDKAAVMKSLCKKYGPTAMVGDGVNDAPALATANVGIAMGGAGADVALETADVVLMADDLAHLPFAIGLAQRSRRTVWQNLSFSMAVIIMLTATVFGADLPLTLGVLGHEGSTVIVVLNGLRLLGFKG
jgi:Zn2+/Cd2+-exporting ATPase